MYIIIERNNLLPGSMLSTIKQLFSIYRNVHLSKWILFHILKNSWESVMWWLTLSGTIIWVHNSIRQRNLRSNYSVNNRRDNIVSFLFFFLDDQYNNDILICPSLIFYQTYYCASINYHKFIWMNVWISNSLRMYW